MRLFTKREILEITVATLSLTIIFSFKGFFIDLRNFPIYLLAVVSAFLFHELAHKFTAIKFGCMAFFKLWPQGIVLGFLLMFFGVKFVAPGAVIIFPFQFARWGFRKTILTVREAGLIAVAGLLVNLFFAIIFGLLPFRFARLIAAVNTWLFFFNLLPFPPLDGAKVLMWSWSTWTFLFIISCLLLFFLI